MSDTPIYEVTFRCDAISNNLLSTFVKLHQQYISTFTTRDVTKLRKLAKNKGYRSDVFLYDDKSKNLISEIKHKSSILGGSGHSGWWK